MDRIKLFTEAPHFLDTVICEAEKNNDTARQLVEGLSDEQLNWKPEAKRWSMAQCLEHLAVASGGFDSYFRETIERARARWPTTRAVLYRPTFVGGLLIRQVVPETTRRFPSPKIFKPSDSSAIHDALGIFLKQQTQFLSFVQESEGTDYNRARLRSPVTPLMRYSLADAFVVTIVHEHRHLGQAWRVRETPGFPN